jgi:hypothetical protein
VISSGGANRRVLRCELGDYATFKFPPPKRRDHGLRGQRSPPWQWLLTRGFITYLKNGGPLANHASTRMTQPYDLFGEELGLDQLERIAIWPRIIPAGYCLTSK